MSNTPQQLKKKNLEWMMLISSFVLYVALLPLLAYSWVNRPFPGFMVNPNNIISGTGSEINNWPPKNITPPVDFPERIIAINDTPIENNSEWVEAIGDFKIGQKFNITLQQPDETSYLASENKEDWGATRTVPVRIIKFTFPLFLRLFGIPYLIGFICYLFGFWAFRAENPRPETKLFVLFTVTAAWAIGATFDIETTQKLSWLWLGTLCFAGPVNLLFSQQFPNKSTLLAKYPQISYLIFLPSLLIMSLGWYTQYFSTDHWAYIQAWRQSYLLNGVALSLSLLTLLYYSFRSNSPLAKQQTRFIIVAALLSFLPITIWFFNYTTISFNPLIFFPPLLFYPWMMGYTISRSRLFNADYIARRVITYLLFTIMVVATFQILSRIYGYISDQTIEPTNSILLGMVVFSFTLLFTTLRDTIQSTVDQLWFRQPVIFEQLLQQFNQELIDAVSSEKIASLLNQYIESGAHGTQVELYLPDSDKTHYTTNKKNHKHLLMGDTPLAQYLQEGKTIYKYNEKQWIELAEPIKHLFKKLNTAVLIPLSQKNELLGFLTLNRPSYEDNFTTPEFHYLFGLANQSIIALERVKVIRNLEERLGELRTISQFSQALNFTISFDDLLELVYVNCDRILRIHDFYIALLDQSGENLEYIFYLQDDNRLVHLENSLIDSEQTDLYQVVQTGQLLTKQDEQFSWLIAPLNVGASTIGIMYTYSKDPEERFPTRQQQLFGVLADHTATAMERWRTNEKLRKRAEQLLTLNEVSSSINMIMELDELLEMILDKSMTLITAEAGSFLMVVPDSNELEFRVARGGSSSAGLIGTRLPINRGLSGRVAQTGQPLIVNDVQQDKRWFSGVDSTSTFITHSILTVPMMRGQEVIGVLQVVNKQNGAPFDDNDQTVLTAFAGQAVIAMENVRLHQETDTELQRKVLQLTLMQQLDRDLNTTLDLSEVTTLTLNWILRISGGDSGGIIILNIDEEANEYDLLSLATSGYEVSFDAQHLNKSFFQTGLIGKVLRECKPDITPNVELISDYVTASFNTKSQMTLPILQQGKAIGVIAIESNQYDNFSSDDLQTAVQIISHATIAITNALLYQQVINANNAKSEFVSMVSHELKTPMTSIRGYTDLMLKGLTGEMSPQQIEFLNTISANIGHMGTLIQDLTDISRIETGQLSIVPSTVSFQDVINDTIVTSGVLCDEKEITINFDLPKDIPSIYGDKQRLVQVLTNLMSNACKYSPPKTEVSLIVRIEKSGHFFQNNPHPMLHCSIKDQGYGIAEEDQHKMFTKFFRSGDPNIRQASGTGLGLSITKGLIEAHGGRIWFDSVINEGTTFHFTIPLA